jgi:signal transduction histidine kinase/CheY-like chemotaxis protein
MRVAHPEVFGTLAVIGALGLAALRQAVAWRLRPSHPQWPMLGITVCGLVFAVARVVHLEAPPDLALTAIRVQYGIGLLMPGFAFAAVEVIGGQPVSRRSFVALAIGAALLTIGVATPWLVDGPIEVHRDAFGHVHLGGHPGWLTMVVLPVASVFAGIGLRRRLRAMPPALVGRRTGYLIALGLFVAAALHDSLMGAGVLGSVFVLEYVYVGFAPLSASYELRHAARQQEIFEERLADKRVQLGEQEIALARARERLARSNTRFRHLVAATGEGVVVCAGARVLDANPAATRLLGPPGEPLRVGVLRVVDVREFVVEGDRATLDRLLADDDGPRELRLVRPGAAPVVASVKAVPAPPGSRGTRVLLIRDVSTERELQRRLATADRLVAVGTLAAGTAHEINNPLLYVMSNAELLEPAIRRLAPSPEAAREPLEMLADLQLGAVRIRDVVRDLMSLARDRGGEVARIDLRETLRRCAAMAGPQLKHRAQVVIDVDGLSPVMASEGRLFQVFLNLIVNAAQALPDGDAAHQRIRLTGRTVGGEVVVEVADTGCGMSREVLDRIFEPFFTTKDVGQGTGLGLSISQGIIADHGGRIEVDSEVGVGTNFRVYLPCANGPVAVAPAPAPVAVPARLGVLIVDDEAPVARSLARVLAGCDVEVADSGRAARAALARRHFDVVLCDVMMPDVTGIQLYRELEAAGDPAIAHFVFMTGGVSTPDAQQFLDRLGPERWLLKPIGAPALRARVAAVGPAATAPSA